MAITPAPTDSDPDLFDLAAQLLGCAPMHLLKVRQEGDQLVVILITGQKFNFDPQSIGADVLNQVTQALAGLTPPALPQPPAPAPAPKARKAK